MKGATPVLASAARMPKNPIRIRIGRSHHFLLSRRKPKNSATRLGCFWLARRSKSSNSFDSGGMAGLARSEGAEVAFEPAVGPVGLPVGLRFAVGRPPE